MGTKKRHVLVAGFKQGELGCLYSLLARNEFEVDRLPRAKSALDLAAEIGFELLVLKFPLPGMEMVAFLDAVRHYHSPCRAATVYVLAEGCDMDQAQLFVGRGANHVASLETRPEELEELFARPLHVAPRAAARLPTRLTVQMGGLTEQFLCQTRNLSATGMLLETPRRYRKGTKFTFACNFPDDDLPTVGRAEVVRHARISREGTEGMGVRFVSLPVESRTRLDSYLQLHLVPPVVRQGRSRRLVRR
jgi:DNA-binding response OmpR family regulator